MYRALSAAVPEPIAGKVLGISGIANLRPLLSSDAVVTEADYPDVDIQALPYADESFDAVLSDQVLEHVRKPWVAVAESFRVAKPGALIVHTTCFQNLIHGEMWGDYFRFTPDGLRSLCPENSEIVACGGWGNRFAHLARSFGWTPRVGRFGIGRLLAMRNEWRAPIAVWVIARKGR